MSTRSTSSDASRRFRKNDPRRAANVLLRLAQPTVSMLPSDMDTTLLFSEAQELVDSMELRRFIFEDDDDDEDDLFRLRRPEAQEASESRRFDLDLELPLLLVETIELEVEEANESLRSWLCLLPFNTLISCISCA